MKSREFGPEGFFSEQELGEQNRLFSKRLQLVKPEYAISLGVEGLEPEEGLVFVASRVGDSIAESMAYAKPLREKFLKDIDVYQVGKVISSDDYRYDWPASSGGILGDSLDFLIELF